MSILWPIEYFLWGQMLDRNKSDLSDIESQGSRWKGQRLQHAILRPDHTVFTKMLWHHTITITSSDTEGFLLSC